MFFVSTNDEGSPVADHQFFLYRYFIIRTTNQTSLLDSQGTKEQMVIDVLKDAMEEKRVDFTYWKTPNILYLEMSLEDRLLYFRYAKTIKRQKKVDGGTDVVEVEDTELKVAVVVFDTKNQFILIQNKTSVFNNTAQGHIAILLRVCACICRKTQTF